MLNDRQSPLTAFELRNIRSVNWVDPLYEGTERNGWSAGHRRAAVLACGVKSRKMGRRNKLKTVPCKDQMRAGHKKCIARDFQHVIVADTAYGYTLGAGIDYPGVYCKTKLLRTEAFLDPASSSLGYKKKLKC